MSHDSKRERLGRLIALAAARVRAVGLLLVVAGGVAAAQGNDTTIAPRRAALLDVTNVRTLRAEHSGRPGSQALIFIPALFCGPWQWQREVNALANRYDIYAVTLPGFDGRPLRDTTRLMERAAHDLAELIYRRGLTRPLVIGHSLGGTLSVLFGERYPTLPGAVIAVEGGSAIAPTGEGRTARVEASAAPFARATPATLDSVLIAQTLRYSITRPSDVAAAARYAARSSLLAIAAWMRDALALDLTRGLRSPQAPILEIVPFDSTIDPYVGFASLAAKRHAYATWVAHTPHGHLEMSDHSRHFVMFDRPAEFDRVLFEAITNYR